MGRARRDGGGGVSRRSQPPARGQHNLPHTAESQPGLQPRPGSRTRGGPVLCCGKLLTMLQLRPTLGRTEDAEAHDACEAASRLRLEEVASAMALRATRPLRRLPSQLPGSPADSAPNPIGRITHGTKQAGERSAGNPHAPFEVAGVGTGRWLFLHGHAAGNGIHSQRSPCTHRDCSRPNYRLLERGNMMGQDQSQGCGQDECKRNIWSCAKRTSPHESLEGRSPRQYVFGVPI